jgi:hypothetical protein
MKGGNLHIKSPFPDYTTWQLMFQSFTMLNIIITKHEA